MEGFWPRPLKNDFWGSLDGVVDDVVLEVFCSRPANSDFLGSAFVVVAALVPCEVSPGLPRENGGSDCLALPPPKRLPLGAGV